ncbi:hypothetical protein SLNWT_4141 [Streptomyces albus]|uniref:Uncharacterized protein n=1 Tax=Streptomyces albus (strain ATCC 21838 / DSM 41398 / FERM P-419 / JCM 4703 / NBRC 107858) TaxID=1081613 RepID=A0A0B5F2H0_STRA4|nr:hypothetical protein SLNWT_4141 [Streptomyces albus]
MAVPGQDSGRAGEPGGGRGLGRACGGRVVAYGLEQLLGARSGAARPDEGAAASRSARGRLGGDGLVRAQLVRETGGSRLRHAGELYPEAGVVDDDLRGIAGHFGHAEGRCVVEPRGAAPRGGAGCSGVHTHLTE